MKKLFIILLFLLVSCTRIETYKAPVYRWEIEYKVGEENVYTHGFPGGPCASYKIERMGKWNVLLVYPYNDNMVEHCFKTDKNITVLTFHLIN